MINPNDRQRMLQEKFRQMGVPSNAGQTGGAQVMASPQNTNMAQRINQIKMGGKKGEFDKFIKAKSAKDKFEPIPEPKRRKNPNEKVSSEHVVAPQSFGAKTSPELSAIESMFNGGGSGYMPTSPGYNQMQQRPMTTELSLDNISLPSMPDPSMYLAQKNSDAYTNQMGMSQQQQPQMQGVPPMPGIPPEMQMQMQMQGTPQPVMNSNSPFAQYTLQNHSQQPVMDGYGNEFQSDMAMQQQYNQGADMKVMMEQVAQSIAERTIKQYITENAGGKNLFEVTNFKTKDGQKVIKTGDGRYYKITPVRINKVD